MERRLAFLNSKRAGESMNNRSVVNEDRISELPEALILQIFCLLPLKTTIATSVLSKQWQTLWKMTPKLMVNQLQLRDVCKSLLSHKAPVLQSLNLRVRVGFLNNAVDTRILIGIALTRNVRELVFEDYFHYLSSFEIPRCLYNCETLETLKVNMCVIMDVPSSVCLKSLRTLHLYFVDFKDDESVLNLFSGCPNLHHLVVRRIGNSNVKTFTIAVPSLQRLTISNADGSQHPSYVINAPSLKYFRLEGFKALESCLIENVPELVEANIIHVSKITCDKLLGSLTLVKRLSLALSPLKIKFPTGSLFYQLVYLELYTNIEAWRNLLTLMLDSSPKLQALKLIVYVSNKYPYVSNKNYLMENGEWNQPKNVPECLLLHLKTFIWEGYLWEQEEEIEVANYILKNTNHLKRATFYSKRISSENRLVVFKDLKSVVKTRNSLHFHFN